MKYLLIFFCLFAFQGLFSQNDLTKVEQAIETIALQYKLDDAQKSNLRVLMQTKNEALKKLRQNETNARESSLKKKEIVMEYEKNFSAMLNEEQLNLYRFYQSMTPDLKKAENGAMIGKDQPKDYKIKSNQ